MMEGSAHFADLFGAYQASFHGHPSLDPNLIAHAAQHDRNKSHGHSALSAHSAHSTHSAHSAPSTSNPVKSTHNNTASYEPSRVSRPQESDESVFTDFMANSASTSAELKVLYDAKKPPDPNQYMQYDKKTHKCEYCGATFSLKSKLDAHIVRHTGEKVYACEICGSFFSEKEDVENHIELVHSKDKPYKCSICGAGFILGHDLKVHENVHTWDLSFRCDVCGKSFSKAQALTKHKLKVHSHDDDIISCRICNEVFEEKEDLEAHFETHNAGLTCTQCGQKFPTMSKLLQHGYIHAGKKPYICQFCDAVFGQKGHLKRHMGRKHQKETLLECYLCDATFVLQEDFEKHHKVHSSSTNIQCKFCKKPFSSIVTLSMHIAQDHSQETGENRNPGNDMYSAMRKPNHGMKDNMMPDPSRMNNFGQNYAPERAHLNRPPQVSWTVGNNMHFDSMEPDETSDSLHRRNHNPQLMYAQNIMGNKHHPMVDNSQVHKSQPPPNVYNQRPMEDSNAYQNKMATAVPIPNQQPPVDDMESEESDESGEEIPPPQPPKPVEITKPSDGKYTTEPKALLTNGVCTICSATFVSRSNLIRHYTNVHGITDPLYACSQCEERFHKKKDLDVHMQTHDTMVCHTCGAKFPTESQLSKHMFVHTGEKPYPCKFCNTGFDQKSHLRRHTIQRHLQEKAHCCSYCGATFVLKSELKKHERTHAGSKRVSCDKCGSSFALVVGLKRHLKIVHGEGKKEKPETETSETEKPEQVDGMEENKDNIDAEERDVEDHADMRKDQDKDKKNEDNPLRHLGLVESSRKEGANNYPDSQKVPMSMEQPLPLYNPQPFMWAGKGQEPYSSSMDVNRGYFPETCMYSANKNVSDMARQIGNDQAGFGPLNTIEGYPFYGSQYFPNAFNNRPGENRFPPDGAPYGAGLGGLPGMSQNPGLMGKNQSPLGDNDHRRLGDEMDKPKPKPEPPKPPKKILEKTFKCECGQMFSSRSHLLRHSSVHTGLRPFACRECDGTFAQKDHLRRHVLCMHVGAKPFKCQKCGAVFSQKCNLNVHLRIHSCDKILKCEQCDMLFKKESAMKKHIEKVHLKIPYYRCKACKDEFIDKEEFDKHVKSHNKPETCSICDTTFPNEAAYLRHNCYQTSEKPFKCDLCNACFSKHSHLKRHTIQKHIDDNLHICGFCDAGYVKKEDLEKHELEHEGEKVFTCDVCSITFPSAKALKTHKKDSHTDDNNYLCKFCNASYTSQTGLRKHEKIHKDDISYKCKECDEEFAQKAYLRKHVREEHSKKTSYFCNLCDAKYTNKAKLREHQREHVKESGYEQKYSCEICSDLFKQKALLIDHKNKKHFQDMYLECSLCGLKFRREHLLKKHHKEDHGVEYSDQKAFQCSMCDMCFSNISGLTIHNRSHKGRKVFVCKTCPNVTFTERDEIEEHVHSEHMEELVKEHSCYRCDRKFGAKKELTRHIKYCEREARLKKENDDLDIEIKEEEEEVMDEGEGGFEEDEEETEKGEGEGEKMEEDEKEVEEDEDEEEEEEEEEDSEIGSDEEQS